MPKNRLLVNREIATYVQVLLDATQASGTTFEATSQLKEMQHVLVEHPALRDALRDETLDADARVNILGSIFEGFDPSVLKVVSVMAERHELGLIHRFVNEFQAKAEEALDAVIVDVTTVVELDDALRTQIKNKLEPQFGKSIVLREHIDPSIMGGIILGAHGKRIDASVAKQLEKTRVVLSSQRSGGER